MIITKEWIHANKTKAGSWNRTQIEALGLSWPPTKGWQQRSEGIELNDFSKHRFEEGAAAESPKGNKKYESVDKRMAKMEARILQLEKQLSKTIDAVKMNII